MSGGSGAETDLNGRSVLDNVETLDAFCKDARDRLRLQWSERMSFLTGAIERLDGLQKVAHVVRDAVAARDVLAHLESAREELRELNTVAAHLELPHDIEPPSAPATMHPRHAESSLRMRHNR